GREPEADRRDARKRRRRPAVRHQPVLRVRRLPEEVERAALEILEERVERALLRRGRRARRAGEEGEEGEGPEPTSSHGVLSRRIRRPRPGPGDGGAR